MFSTGWLVGEMVVWFIARLFCWSSFWVAALVGILIGILIGYLFG